MLTFPFPSDITMSPIMGMRRIASRDRLKMLSPGSLFNPDGSIVPVSVANAEAFQLNSDRIKRVSSSSSISSLGMILYLPFKVFNFICVQILVFPQSCCTDMMYCIGITISSCTPTLSLLVPRSVRS